MLCETKIADGLQGGLICIETIPGFSQDERRLELGRFRLVAHSKFKSLLCIREFDGKLCNEIWSTQFRISEAPAWYFANDLTESRNTDISG